MKIKRYIAVALCTLLTMSNIMSVTATEYFGANEQVMDNTRGSGSAGDIKSLTVQFNVNTTEEPDKFAYGSQWSKDNFTVIGHTADPNSDEDVEDIETIITDYDVYYKDSKNVEHKWEDFKLDDPVVTTAQDEEEPSITYTYVKEYLIFKYGNISKEVGITLQPTSIEATYKGDAIATTNTKALTNSDIECNLVYGTGSDAIKAKNNMFQHGDITINRNAIDFKSDVSVTYEFRSTNIEYTKKVESKVSVSCYNPFTGIDVKYDGPTAEGTTLSKDDFTVTLTNDSHAAQVAELKAPSSAFSINPVKLNGGVNPITVTINSEHCPLEDSINITNDVVYDRYEAVYTGDRIELGRTIDSSKVEIHAFKGDVYDTITSDKFTGDYTTGASSKVEPDTDANGNPNGFYRIVKTVTYKGIELEYRVPIYDHIDSISVTPNKPDYKVYSGSYLDLNSFTITGISNLGREVIFNSIDVICRPYVVTMPTNATDITAKVPVRVSYINPFDGDNCITKNIEVHVYYAMKSISAVYNGESASSIPTKDKFTVTAIYAGKDYNSDTTQPSITKNITDFVVECNGEPIQNEDDVEVYRCTLKAEDTNTHITHITTVDVPVSSGDTEDNSLEDVKAMYDGSIPSNTFLYKSDTKLHVKCKVKSSADYEEVEADNWYFKDDRESVSMLVTLADKNSGIVQIPIVVVNPYPDTDDTMECTLNVNVYNLINHIHATYDGSTTVGYELQASDFAVNAAYTGHTDNETQNPIPASAISFEGNTTVLEDENNYTIVVTDPNASDNKVKTTVKITGVTPAKTVKGIKASLKQPHEYLSYGDKVNVDTVVVSAVYTDNTEENITDQIEFSNNTIAIYNGEYTATFAYEINGNKFTCSLDIPIHTPIHALHIGGEDLNELWECLAGTTITKDDIPLYVTYDGVNWLPLDSEYWSFADGVTSYDVVSGENVIRIAYGDLTYEEKFTGVDLIIEPDVDHIEAKCKRDSYSHGDPINADSISIYAVYADEDASKEDITEYIITDDMYVEAYLGTQTFHITYNVDEDEYTCDLDIPVSTPIDKFEVDSTSFKPIIGTSISVNDIPFHAKFKYINHVNNEEVISDWISMNKDYVTFADDITHIKVSTNNNVKVLCNGNEYTCEFVGVKDDSSTNVDDREVGSREVVYDGYVNFVEGESVSMNDFKLITHYTNGDSELSDINLADVGLTADDMKITANDEDTFTENTVTLKLYGKSYPFTFYGVPRDKEVIIQKNNWDKLRVGNSVSANDFTVNKLYRYTPRTYASVDTTEWSCDDMKLHTVGFNTLHVNYAGNELSVDFFAYPTMSVSYNGLSVLSTREPDMSDFSISVNGVPVSTSDTKLSNNGTHGGEDMTFSYSWEWSEDTRYSDVLHYSIPIPKANIVGLDVDYVGPAIAVGNSVNNNDIKVTAIVDDGRRILLDTDEWASSSAIRPITQIGNNSITITFDGVTSSVEVTGVAPSHTPTPSPSPSPTPTYNPSTPNVNPTPTYNPSTPNVNPTPSPSTPTSKPEEVVPKSIKATYNGDAVPVGYKFDKSEVIVTATYSDGSSRILNSDEWSVKSTKITKADVNTFTIKYAGLKCKLKIDGYDLVSVFTANYNGNPVTVGSSVNIDDIAVYAVYSSGKKERIKLTAANLSTTMINKVGDNVITITLPNSTDTLSITVKGVAPSVPVPVHTVSQNTVHTGVGSNTPIAIILLIIAVAAICLAFKKKQNK